MFKLNPDQFDVSADDDGPIPKFESGLKCFGSTALTPQTHMGTRRGYGHVSDVTKGRGGGVMRREVDALACFDIDHPAFCLKCQPAPREGQEHEYKLVQTEECDEGKNKTGERRLRLLIAKRPEWVLDSERLKTIHLARQASYHELADLLERKSLPRLRKCHFMEFCRILHLRCDIWKSKTQYIGQHLKEAAAGPVRHEFVLEAAGAAPAPALGGAVDADLAQHPYAELPGVDYISQLLESSDNDLPLHMSAAFLREGASSGAGRYTNPMNGQLDLSSRFSYEEEEGLQLRRQRRTPLAKPFSCTAVAVIAQAETIADSVLRSVPDGPEFVRVESLLRAHMRERRTSTVRASFFETQRILARMHGVRIELAQARLRFRSGGNMAAISHIVSSGGKTDGGSKSASHHYNTNSVQVQDSTNDYFFIPGEHCPLVRAVDNMAINIERHLNERMAQTTQVEDGGQGHVGLLAERVRMLAECGYTDAAMGMKNFIMRKLADPSLPVPEQGPASYFLCQKHFKTRINTLLEHVKSVMRHTHHCDADDYARIGLKMVSIIEATFVGVKEVWGSLEYVPLTTVMEMMQEGA